MNKLNELRQTQKGDDPYFDDMFGGYDTLYWLTGSDDEIEIEGVKYEVIDDINGVEPYSSEENYCQAVLLKNGELENDDYSSSKRYIKIAELPGNKAVIAFLPAFNKK